MANKHNRGKSLKPATYKFHSKPKMRGFKRTSRRSRRIGR